MIANLFNNHFFMGEALVLIVYVVSLLFAISPQILSRRIVFLVYLFCAFVINLSVRQNLGGDIPGYLEALDRFRSREPFTDSSFFFTLSNIYSVNKEPLFWYPGLTLYRIFDNPYYPVVFFDIIFYLSMYFGIQKILECDRFKVIGSKLTGLYFVSLIFFPNVVNISSSFRQAIASSFIILALGFTLERKQLKSIVVFGCAILIHNPVLLFYPMLAVFNVSLKRVVWQIIFLSIIGFFMLLIIKLPFSYLVRGGGPIDLGVYVAVRDIGILSLAFVLSMFLTYRANATEFFPVISQQFFCLVLSIFFVFFFNSGDLNRLFFYITAILFPLLILLLNRTLGDSVMVRIVSINFLPFLPWIIF